MNIDKLKSLLAAAPLTDSFMDDYEYITREEHNLIVAMRNCLPELLAVVEAAHTLRDAGLVRSYHWEDLNEALAALSTKLETV